MISPLSFAADSLQIIPEAQKPAEVWKQVDCIAGSTSGAGCQNAKWKTVRDRYNNQSKEYDKNWDTGAAFATWVFSWDTIIEYVRYIITFLSQLWILIWVIMIVYAGYQYASAGIMDKTPKPEAIKNAIGWVLVVIFAYAIIKALTAAFL